MSVLRSKDFLAGAVSVAIGGAVVWIASDYGMGTPRRMGPGFFPVSLGVILALIGAAIMLGALRSQDRLPPLHLRPLIVIPGSILVFALLLPRIGYAPTGLVIVLLAGFAAPNANRLTLLLLAAGLVPATWLLFSVALGVPVPLFAWRL